MIPDNEIRVLACNQPCNAHIALRAVLRDVNFCGGMQIP